MEKTSHNFQSQVDAINVFKEKEGSQVLHDELICVGFDCRGYPVFKNQFGVYLQLFGVENFRLESLNLF
jgi:hypothetical protein